MKIKEDRELKLPRLMFKTIQANFMFVCILAFWFVNSLLYLVDYPSLTLIPLGLISFGLISFYLLMVGSVGEAFNSSAPQMHFDDLKRTVIYLLISLLVFVGIQFYADSNKVPVPPKVLVSEQTIKITELSIFDTHNKTIKYAIGYKDSNGTIRWQSVFTALNDRTEYLKTLVSDGKFKVKINFKVNKHNTGSLEIIKQTIKG